MSVELKDSRNRDSFGDAAEAAEFVSMLEKFERGEIHSEQYRQYRLSRGIYGQKQDGVHMVRVKIPQGVLTGAQLRQLADSSDKYSGGFGHVTTRQNFQFHNVKPEHVGPFMEEIANCGLTTREACSHTVRNVVGCAYAGVCNDAPFDVTPYAEAITRHFLRGKWGSGLPRKFKITASGCEDDCAKAAMNDIGIIARMQGVERGFRFVVGGGTSTLPRNAGVLHDFLPAEELLAACEAVARVFHAEGERKNLQKARLKWAIQKLGWDGFKQKYEQQLAEIRAEGGRPLPAIPPPEQPPNRWTPLSKDPRPLPAAFHAWRQSNVRQQVQQGWAAATVFLRLGDISSAQLRGLAGLIEKLGDGTVRTTLEQNVLIRWVRDEELGALWSQLEALGLGGAAANTVSDVTSCPGAETCKIAVTASRGMAQLLHEHLKEKHDGKKTAQTDIKVSGCPNGCGQHHVSAIGLQGGVRKVGDHLVPQYHLLIGGQVDKSGASFGRLVARIPARKIPEAVDRLIAHYDARGGGESPRDFFRKLDLAEAKKLVGDLAELNESTAKPEDFIDLGSTVQFKVVAGDGECAA